MEEMNEVIGFQFEPIRESPAEACYSDGSDLELEQIDSSHLKRIHGDVGEWCTCKSCRKMPSDTECVCCREIPEIEMYHLNNGKPLCSNFVSSFLLLK